MSEPDENADSDAARNSAGNGTPYPSQAEPQPWLPRHIDQAFLGQMGCARGALLLYLAIRKGLLLLLGSCGVLGGAAGHAPLVGGTSSSSS